MPPDQLRPQTQDIFEACPRFRVLVLGKAGSGKSSLINSAFNVDLANVSRIKPGKSDINEEIYSADENARFVLHDSQGFEAGESVNFSIIERFIEERKGREKLADRLHAIWLCIEIPTAGGSVFERGHERFFDLHIPDIPVVIVFTKYDKLVASLRRENLRNNAPVTDDRDMQEQARAGFKTLCIKPLEEEFAKRGYSYRNACVSTRPAYRDTISRLVQITQDQASEGLWLIAAVAQRSNLSLNIEASIAVGKRKYWRGLASSAHFPGITLQSCLHVIHIDIIATWNMFDPEKYLQKPDFEAMISACVNDEKPPGGAIMTSLTIAGTAASISAAASGPLSPIVAPAVFGGVMFASWVYTTYAATPATLRLLMSYIVDATIIMQSLFILMTERRGRFPVTPDLIALAARAYLESDILRIVHNEILAFSKKATIPSRDHALEEIIRLIEGHPFDPPESYKQSARNANDAGPGNNATA